MRPVQDTHQKPTIAGLRPIDAAWTAIAVLVPTLVGLLSKLGATDLAYQLRAGETILSTGRIPRVDTFTFSSGGVPWLDQQWGGQVLLATAARLGEWATLKVAKAVLIGLVFALLFLACRAAGARVRTSSLLTLGGFVVGAPALAMRPQLIAVPLFAATLWLLAGRRAHPGRLWAIPVLAAACANIHGSFILFPVLVGLAWLEDRWRKEASAGRLLGLAVVTAAATLANPFGARIWTYAYDLSTDPVIRRAISEWAPVSLALASGWLMLLSGVGVAAFFARRTERVPWPAIVSLAAFFLLAMAAQRAIMFWALLVPVTLAGLLEADRPREEPSRDTVAPAAALIGTLAATIVVLLPWWGDQDPSRMLAQAPQGLTRAASALPAGSRLFVHQPWGSWFEYALPQDTVFVDSRIEIAPADVWDDYDEVAFAGAGWEEALDRWQPDAIVADKEDWSLIPYLREDPDWRVVYEDEEGVLFVPAG